MGDFDPNLVRRLELPVGKDRPNLFAYALNVRRALWARDDPKWELAGYLSAEIKALSGGKPFYLAPVGLAERPLGLLYADCRRSDRALTEEGFLSFQHFARQANLAFTLISLGAK